MKKIIYRPIWPILGAIVIITGAFFIWQKSKANFSEQFNQVDQQIVAEKKDRVAQVPVVDGSTYAELMTGQEIPYAIAMDIYNAAKDIYDLATIRVGKNLELIYDKDTDDFKQLVYQPNTEERLYVSKFVETDEAGQLIETWQAELKPIDYEVRVVTKEGKIESSMYQAALDNNIDERAIIEVANAFQWTLDFAMDPRVGDEFKFVYEERYLEGQYIMPGQVLAGIYINDGAKYEVYYFEESDDNKGFFDKDGNSVQKMFLKAPVEFRYISSGFTTGLRYVEAFNVSTGHRAIDYAAAYGTPIRAVGDGTVTFAGWSSAGYGNLTSIRHNGTYSTNYAHQSKFAVKKGQKVKQGQIIGYVGSTGFSTGPHLHYEMVKNGVKVNPLKETLPPGEPIKEENRVRFVEEMNKYQKMLES